MKDTVLNKKDQKSWEKERLSFFPHAFNYIVKEEVVKRLNDIDMAKICAVKSRIKDKNTSLDYNAVAEKLMEGE